MTLSGNGLSWMLALVLAVSLSACKSGNQQAAAAPTTVPVPEETWTSRPIAVPVQQARPVKEGSAPLFYLVESAATVRIVDMTSKRDLVVAPAGRRSLVSVDADAGIKVAGSTMRPGPLPADHRYGIFLENDEANVVRSGIIQPEQPAPVPATQAAP